MTNNGFYAAMKTDYGVKAVYIDEEQFRQEAQREKQQRREEEARKARSSQEKAKRRFARAAVYVAKQELKLIGMGMGLWLGHRAGLVDLAFAAPVLITIQTVICFRAGRFWGRWGRKFRAGM